MSAAQTLRENLQGAQAADATKRAMVKVDRRLRKEGSGARLLLQVQGRSRLRRSRRGTRPRQSPRT